ncbi:lipid A-modifier LpxR family protein [Aquimarina algiphila]|uniref:lipid A-modifier LpxR family protein n=1 Tax=Aquimarina algiphila TaxID=2047982 RepID=UPI0024917997|nr:lipid A-modifier LpxR family protein [Aquimarina algiphila]
MLRKNLLFFTLLFTLLCPFYVTSQENHFKNQIRSTNDNDIYVFYRDTDRYYSYGVGFDYSFTADKFLGLQNIFKNKITNFYNIGVKIEGYTPSGIDEFVKTDIVEGPENFDRPFAGLLYAFLNTTYVFDRSFLKAEILTGILGPSSQAGNLQDWFHESISNDPIYDGWQFQLKDQFLVNMNLDYLYDFNPNNNWLNFFGKGNLKLGNLYIQAAPTAGFRLGKFEKPTHSVSFNNSILSPKKTTEIFFQFSIESRINLFNATIQGNLFKDDPVSVSDLNNLSWHMNNEIHFSRNRLSLSVIYSWSTGVLDTAQNHVFGIVGVAYRF